MPAASRERGLSPRGAFPYGLAGCHWAEVQRFLQQAEAAGIVRDQRLPSGWEQVSGVVDHGDRIEWRRQGRSIRGNYSEDFQLLQRKCGGCQTATAVVPPTPLIGPDLGGVFPYEGMKVHTLALCRSCRLTYDRSKGRQYTAKWRYKKTGVLPAWAELPVACSHCGATFTPKRTTARFCSTACRVAAHRAKAND